MKFILVILTVSLCSVIAFPSETYTSQYDSINLDDILRNQRLYKNYFNCLIDKARCTPDAKELKDALPDALATACAKCTEKQKKGSEKVIKYMIEKKPEDYAILEKMYDPEGAYRKKYKDEAKKYGIPA